MRKRLRGSRMYPWCRLSWKNLRTGMRLRDMRGRCSGCSSLRYIVTGTCMMACRSWNYRQIPRLFLIKTSSERTITCLQRIVPPNKKTHNFSGNPSSNPSLGLPSTTLSFSTVREWTRSSASYTSKVLQPNNHFLCLSESPKLCCPLTTIHRFRVSSHTWKSYGKWSPCHTRKSIINWIFWSRKWISVEVTCVCFRMCCNGLCACLLTPCWTGKLEGRLWITFCLKGLLRCLRRRWRFLNILSKLYWRLTRLVSFLSLVRVLCNESRISCEKVWWCSTFEENTQLKVHIQGNTLFNEIILNLSSTAIREEIPPLHQKMLQEMELLPATVIKQFSFSTQVRLLRVQEKIDSENNSRLPEQT